MKTLRRLTCVSIIFLSIPIAMFARAQQTQVHRAAETVATYSNRLYLMPPTQAVVAGYFTSIQGLEVPLFSGAPSESTAYLTWTLGAAGAAIVTNGDVSTAVLKEGEVLNIYYNSSPNQSWNDPTSFSSGELVATFRSSPGTETSTGPVSLVTQSYVLTWSKEFVFGGQIKNLGRLLGPGFTNVSLGSNVPLPPVPGYVLVFAAGGSALAVGH